MTDHNSIFGWIHSMRISENNLFGGNISTIYTPYPTIIFNPSLKQSFKNWNTADTGMVIITTLLFSVGSYFGIQKSTTEGFFERRRVFLHMSRMGLLVGIFLGLRNSYYRLSGFVPNGLPANKVYEPVKYNYSSEFLKNSVWKYVFEDKRRPA